MTTTNEGSSATHNDDSSQSFGPKMSNLDEEDEMDNVREKNYVTECTHLYMLIETVDTENDWAKVLRFLDEDMAEAADQARTWVTRFEEDGDTTSKVKWSQLPLHLAIVCRAPFKVIETLIKMYPQALRCTDDQHMLPLHLALRHGIDDDVVLLLLEYFPDAINAKGKNGRTAIDCAMRAKSKVRGKILHIVVEKTRSRLGKAAIIDRESMKATIASHLTEIQQLKWDLDGHKKLVKQMKDDLGKVKDELKASESEKKAMHEKYDNKVKELEIAKADIEEEMQNKTSELSKQKLAETLALQKKLEEVESEKQASELARVKSLDEREALRKELVTFHEHVASSVSIDDLKVLQEQFDKLRTTNLDKVREDTHNEYEELKAEMEKSLKATKSYEHNLKSELQTELEKIKAVVEELKPDDATMKTSDDMQALRAEVKALKEEIKSRAEASKTKVELAELKKAMEMELMQTEGKTREELVRLRKAVESANINELRNKTAAELSEVKAELTALKKELSLNELANKTRKDLEVLIDSMKDMLAEKGNIKLFSALNKELKAYDKVFTDASNEEIVEKQASIDLLKAEMKRIQTCIKIKTEADALLGKVQASLKNVQGKSKDTLTKIKKIIKNLLDGVEKHNAEKMVEVKGNLANVSQLMKRTEDAIMSHFALADFKDEIEAQLKRNADLLENDIEDIKTAVYEVDLNAKERKSIKKRLTDQIKEAYSEIESQILNIKKLTYAIDVESIEVSNTEAWEDVRSQIEALKVTLRQKNLTEISESERHLLALKKVIGAMDNDYDEKREIRDEIEAMRAEIRQRGDSETAIKQSIRDLKMKAAMSPRVQNTKKAGIKKFLSRRFNNAMPSPSRNAAFNWTSSVDSGAVVEATESRAEREIVECSSNRIVTLSPPSVARGGAPLVWPSSEDSSDDGRNRVMQRGFQGTAPTKKIAMKKAASAPPPSNFTSGMTSTVTTTINEEITNASVSSSTTKTIPPPSIHTKCSWSSRPGVQTNGEVEVEAAL